VGRCPDEQGDRSDGLAPIVCMSSFLTVNSIACEFQD